MPGSTTFPVPAPDGVTLIGRQWALPGSVTRRGAVLVVHGVGEHSARYDHVADALHAIGLDVRSYDQRGFGLSEGPRGRLPWPDALLDDAQTIEFLSGTTPDLPLRHHILPEQVTHDPDVIRAIKADPLMHNHVSPRLIMSIISAGQGAMATAPALTVPTLLQAAGSDSVVMPEKSRQFAEVMPEGLATLRWYAGLFHEIYSELPADRARVLADLQDWLKTQL